MILPESQFGFRANRGTVDIIFCLRQIQEKFLCQLLSKFGCPPKFARLLRSTRTWNAVNGSLSDVFPVNNAVKQGYVLALTLFLLFLSAMLSEATTDLAEGIYIHSRTTDGLFNLS